LNKPKLVKSSRVEEEKEEEEEIICFPMLLKVTV
jgi:hypothetical protein